MDGQTGPKTTTNADSAVCATQHPEATACILRVLADGGNAVDAAIAACLLQATTHQEMTNHTGMVTALVWEARTGLVHELNSMGTVPDGLPPLRPIPQTRGYVSNVFGQGPMAVIPGFVPGLAVLHERLATRPWPDLCQPAIQAAEEGHEVTAEQAYWLTEQLAFYLYTPSGRAHFAPGGRLPRVGDRWRKPELAATLRRLAAVGPEEFTSGDWARAFVARANDLGWAITLDHMTAIPPLWMSGTRWSHRGHEIVQMSPPERQAGFSALVLGVLDELDIVESGPPSRSALSMFWLAHTLRRATADANLIADPAVFGDVAGTLMGRDFHRHVAAIIRGSLPRKDLTHHTKILGGPTGLRAAGSAGYPIGSCELSIVDAEGNWVQMMNTLQGGGIPGEVVGGVCMVGSHAQPNLGIPLGVTFAGPTRIRGTVGHTLVFRDGRPWLALGSPGEVWITVPQVLSNILDHGMSPDDAAEEPFTRGLQDDYRLPVEARLAPEVVDGLAGMGVLVDPLTPYEPHFGSFQMTWRSDDGRLRAATGSRRWGATGGL